ncbi:MAG: DUF115 domain-containing protein [Synergistaceae bacterium]|nr:DUF115 domain-containing protein [Synergistaceae bacterium]
MKSGNINLNLHSAYDVEREMENLLAPLDHDDENQLILIFGLGYGHCLDYIKKKRIKYKRVVVFEPYNDILQDTLKKRRLHELLGRRDVYVHLFKIPNEMSSLLIQEAMSSRNVKIIFHISYRTIYKDLYDNVLRTFISEKTSINTSIATFEHFIGEWTNNQFKSIKRLDHSAAALYGKFKGVPGIVASAGPSLEKHFDKLRGIYDKAVIVSPGTSSRIFNSQKIGSHISMSIDSQIYQANIYNGFNLDSVLVGSYRLNPQVCERFPNRVFRVILNTEFIARYYNEWANRDVGAVDDHASVASSAIDLLFNMGCNPIILLGQDLCYYDNRLYAGAAKNTLSGQYLNMVEDVDIHGAKVFTYSGFKAMQHDMENINIHYRPYVKIYNATESGLNIHGIENVTFDYILEKFIRNNPFNVPEVFKSVFDDIDESGNNAIAHKDNTTNWNRDSVSVSKRSMESDSAGNNAIAHKDNANQNNKSVSEFLKHVLEECGKAEDIIREKEAEFSKFEKLKARGVARSRLNSEMSYISSYNKHLEDIKFYKDVLQRSTQQQLTYHRAAASYISDSGEDYDGVEVFEKRLDGAILDYINKIKIIIAMEMVGEEAMKDIERKAHEGILLE